MDVLLGDWNRQPPPGMSRMSEKPAVAAHVGGDDAMRAGPVAQDRRAGAVAEEHAGVAIGQSTMHESLSAPITRIVSQVWLVMNCWAISSA